MGGRARIVAIALLLAAIALSLGGAPAARAAAQPSLKVEVIGSGKVAGTGINCGLGALACYATYASTAAVSLTATPSTGWTFSGWADDASTCVGPASCPVAPDPAGHTATAVFNPPSGTVQSSTFDIALASPANGTVTGGPGSDPIDCPTTPAECSISVLAGSTITVVEQPSTGFFFSGWGGSCSGTSVACATYLSSSENVSATFVASTPHELSVSVNGTGTVSGGGIACSAGASCDAQEPPNSSVTLTASAASGYAFTGWSGDCLGTQTTCAVQMDTDRSVTATFAALVPLTVTASGNGTVTGGGITCGTGGTTCSAGEPPQSTVMLTASPAFGASVFWSGCTSSSGNSCTVTIGTTANSVSATFTGGTAPPVPSNSLAVSVTGDGYVTAAAGSGTIYCTAAGGASCTANVPSGSSVTLSAIPASGLAGNFTAWTGDCNTFATTSCTLTMNGAKSVGAMFAGGNTTYALSAEVTGSGSISGAGLNCAGSGGAGCSAQQAAGAAVTLIAAPSFGATFSGWSGGCSGASTACTVTMTVAKTVTATFITASFGTESLAIEVTGAGSVVASEGTCSSAAGKTDLCTQSYAAGKAVKLTAKAAAGFVFAGWKGGCTGAKTTCTVTLTSSAEVTATFARPFLAPTLKPAVAKTKTGYRVTLWFAVRERGTLTLVGKLGTKAIVSRVSRVAAGSRRLVLAVAKPGRYVFTLTLDASGKHSIRWAVQV